MLKNHLKLYHRHWHWKRAGIVFIHVPKAAGTSFSVPIYGRFLGHYSVDEVNRFNASILSTLPSFGVVRNPWDRCLSAYRFAKRPEINDGKTPEINAEIRKAVAPYESFESFVIDWLAKQDINKSDYVFQEQSNFLCNTQNKVLVDFVGKIEKLGSLHQWLRENFDPNFSIVTLNSSGEKVDFKKWYSPQTWEIVGELYKRDISNFYPELSQ